MSLPRADFYVAAPKTEMPRAIRASGSGREVSVGGARPHQDSPGAPLDADGRAAIPARRPASASCGVLAWRRGAILLALCFIVLDFIELPQNRIGCWPEDERG
jgi:hypothetical protein